jgi:hypothetical protein
MTMRFATCLVAALLSTATLTTQIAAASGGSYESLRAAPQVMSVSMHYVYGTPGAEDSTTRRAFVITQRRSDLEKQQEGWTMIAPRSYDATSLISLSPLRRSTAVTLIGPSGTRVVRTSSRVVLRDAFFRFGTLEALEVPATVDDQIEIALAGSHADAVWHAMRGSYTLTSKIIDTDLSVTMAYEDGAPRATLHAGTRNIGTFEGYPQGAIDVGGARYFVMQRQDGIAYTVPAA